MARKGEALGRTMATRSWTEDVHDQLETLYCGMGRDVEDIARILGKTAKAVQTQIYALGLRLTPQAVQARRARGISSKGWKPGRECTKLMRPYV
jgi:hypothetical protein